MTIEPGANHRDLYGYGAEPPDAAWPGGARVAVSLVLNVEEGSEQRVTRGDPRNEDVYDMVESIEHRPNLTMESHFDYGARAGYWRIVRIFERFEVTCTVNACAEALELTPWIAEDCVRRGFEISCHGDRWMSHSRMDPEEEAASIRNAVDRITQICSVRPVGWHTRCPHTENTRRLLIAEGGFVYDSDAYDDDLPYLVDSGDSRRHVVVPYSLDTNDMRFQRPESAFVGASSFAEYVNDAFDCLWEEGAQKAKMMTVGLHPRVIGRPARALGLERILEHMCSRPTGTVWFATREQIARHWLAEHGADATVAEKRRVA
jgi:peptidoglycan/xylan/chitin deacetylase (PgdA/CDA1 family)